HGYRSRRKSHEAQARARSRLVPACRVAVTRRAFDSVRHQQAALRHPERHHGRQEKRYCHCGSRLARRARRSYPESRAHLRAAKNQENRIHHRLAKRNRRQAGRKIAPRSAGALMKILLVTEQREGKWTGVSFETLAAAQQIVQHTKGSLTGVVIGKGVAPLADQLAGYQLDDVLLVDHDLLDKYTPDGYSLALKQMIESVKPDLVLFPHTYQVRDFAPKLAASMNKGMIGDCIDYRYENGKLIFVRQMFQGRTSADVVFTGEAPWIASFQASAFRADLATKHAGGKAPIKSVPVELKPEQIRTKPLELFREAKQAVDLTAAPILVSVGRGIKGPENIALAEKLAKATHAEPPPPMGRQLGRAGQPVAPKLYLALGSSGAIQHVVGMKGSRTIAAINKDQNAPIFEIADYGIVGDLFEIVPALIEEFEKTAHN